MSPSQTINVTGQAFTPDRFHATWRKPIEPAPRWNIECLEPGLLLHVSHRWFHDSNFNPCMPCLIHPATRSSSAGSPETAASGFDPMVSRPGARFPGLWLLGVGGARG